MTNTRFQFWIDEEQLNSLALLPGSISEHIRRAIDKYLHEIEKKRLKVSLSPSYDGKKD